MMVNKIASRLRFCSRGALAQSCGVENKVPVAFFLMKCANISECDVFMDEISQQ